MLQRTAQSSFRLSITRQFIAGLLALCGCFLFIPEPKATTASSVKNWPTRANVQLSRAQQDEKEVRPLEPGQPVSRELSGGEVHSYRVVLSAGQYLHVVAFQQGIDVVLALIDAGGKRLIEMDSPNGVLGPEAASLVSASAGTYRIEVSSLDTEAVRGRYQIKIEELRAAAPRDNDRLTAQVLFVEGRELMTQGTGDSLRLAIQKLETALPLWRSVGDRQREFYTSSFIGSCYDLLSEYQKALDVYFPLLPLVRELNDRVGEADTLSNIGSEYYSLGENQKALDYYNRGIEVGSIAGQDINQSPTLNNIALIYQDLGEMRRALDYFNRALPMLRASGDRRGTGITLNNIGQTYTAIGENEKALDYFNQSLPLARAAGDPQGESVTTSNIGSIYEAIGDHEKALDYYKQALELSRAAGFRRGEAITLNNIGGLYNSLDEWEKALEYLNQALPIWQAINERSGVARTLNNIGLSYTISGDNQKALDYYNRALLIMRELGDRPAEAQTLSNIGAVYDTLGEKQKALEYLTSALPLRQAVEDRRGEALTLNHMAATTASLNDNQKALEYYNRSLSLSQAVKDRKLEAAALRGIAHVERDLGHLATARARIEEALNIIETLRSKIASPSLRTSYFASVQQYFELEIDVLMRLHQSQPAQGFDAIALQASERGRARNLLELLSEARVDIRQGVDPLLIERERSLQQRLNDKAERQTQLLSKKHTEEQAAAFQKEIEELLTQYQEVEARIRINSPRYAALTQPQPLSFRDIQKQVLEPDTVLLEYALGDEKSYLWAVTPNSIDSFSLPSRKEIETAARRVYDLLTARNRHIKFETAEERNARLVAADAEYWQAATALSRMTLSPVAARLGSKRLLIVSDGALDYVPFAALPVSAVATIQRTSAAQQNTPSVSVEAPAPLVLEHEIVSLPSASTLAALRREVAGRKPASKTLAVVADPVFEKEDERVRVSGKSGKPTESQTARAAEPRAETRSTAADVFKSAKDTGEEVEGGRILRLPFTRREANQIAALVPERERKQALDFEANRAVALSRELGLYKYVHFATHGFLNSVHPELSGIVLSLVDPQGAEQDGFLRANEIFNLKLPAEMVVLSGCRTGLGKEIKGEGLLGLTRGFMYAGSARVLVSLWGISDEASAELMTKVYKGMLGKEKLRPAAALRTAQATLWKDKRWQAPYYWAAFVLQGEPR
jgi:CHAT domain-containing protein/Tfp pilus assembly protein PilF